MAMTAGWQGRTSGTLKTKQTLAPNPNFAASDLQISGTLAISLTRIAKRSQAAQIAQQI
jgi:hypothetical protein